MTVAELIESLQRLDPRLEAVVAGLDDEHRRILADPITDVFRAKLARGTDGCIGIIRLGHPSAHVGQLEAAVIDSGAVKHLLEKPRWTSPRNK